MEGLEQALEPPKSEIDEEAAQTARYIGLATVLLKNKKYKKAKKTIDRALKHEPSSRAAQAILRVILTAQGDRSQVEVRRAERAVVVDGTPDKFADDRAGKVKGCGCRLANADRSQGRITVLVGLLIAAVLLLRTHRRRP